MHFMRQGMWKEKAKSALEPSRWRLSVCGVESGGGGVSHGPEQKGDGGL